MFRVTRVILPIIPVRCYAVGEDDPLIPELTKSVVLVMLDTNEYICINGNCSKCGSEEHKVFRVRVPGRKPAWTYICPEGHEVMRDFVETELIDKKWTRML
jgi:hypothetical protein